MNYCSLDDAFSMAPGCGQDYSAKEARREERRKARRCKGPAATFLGIDNDKDPDRQNLERPKDIEAMNPKTGLKAHVPVDAPLGMEPFQDINGVVGPCGDIDTIDDGIRPELAKQRLFGFIPRTDDDPVGDKQRSTLPTPSMLIKALSSTGLDNKKKKNFFGADPDDDDSFANYQPDAKNYLMEPSFTSAFVSMNPDTKNMPSGPALAIPSVNNYWKPQIQQGLDTSFFSKIPAPGG